MLAPCLNAAAGHVARWPKNQSSRAPPTCPMRRPYLVGSHDGRAVRQRLLLRGSKVVINHEGQANAAATISGAGVARRPDSNQPGPGGKTADSLYYGGEYKKYKAYFRWSVPGLRRRRHLRAAFAPRYRSPLVVSRRPHPTRRLPCWRTSRACPCQPVCRGAARARTWTEVGPPLSLAGHRLENYRTKSYGFPAMRVFKTRTFCRSMKRSGLADPALWAAVLEMTHGLIDADLGGQVVKKRVALPGQGKRASVRTSTQAN